MKIFFIRHTSVRVVPGTCYGMTDVGLNDTFEQEATEVKRNLDGVVFDCVFSSPLTRARRLAAFCGYPDAVIDARVRELNMGEWEMQRFDEISDPHLKVWYENYLYERPTGGETFQEQLLRVRSFVDEMVQKGYGTVGVFCHGGVLECAKIIGGINKMDDAFHNITPYGGIVVIECSNNR